MKKRLASAWNNGPGPESKKDYLILYIKGFFMGIADLIPGVSGGTIALISGIYDQLLAAISSANKKFFAKIFKLKILEGIDELHLRFLIPLLFGVLTSFVTLSRLMHYLMNEHPVTTWSFFFGLIMASITIIWKELKKPFSGTSVILIIIGGLTGHLLVSLIPVVTPEHYPFIFLCGVISITAMILPGISGSFILLILGKYEYITGALKNPFGEGNLTLLMVFSSGALVGLLGFSRFLNFCMSKHREATMAFLTGLLIGTIKKVWPWKIVLESRIIRGKVKVLREINTLPTSQNFEFYLSLVLIFVGFALIIIMENKARERKNS